MTYETSASSRLFADDNFMIINHKLTQFNASILSRKFVDGDTLSDFLTPLEFNYFENTVFSVDENNPEGRPVSGKSWVSIPILMLFSTPYPDHDRTILLSGIEQINDVQWTGEFWLFVYEGYSNNYFSNRYSDSGSWVADYRETNSQFEPVPLPASLPLFVGALALLGITAGKRKRI